MKKIVRESTAAEGRDLLHRAAERFGLTARGYHRILRVARTIADLAQSRDVEADHIAEAMKAQELQEEKAA